jgi:two-component system phosphate regulon response regulator PhoB
MKTVLIVDDNDDLRMMLAHQLHRKGYRVIMAGGGAQGVEKCIAEKPDVVLMDVLMPGMDGTEAGAAIGAHPETKGIPVIYLTSLIQGGEPVVSDEPSVHVSLPKSITVDDLCGWIETILSKSKPR